MTTQKDKANKLLTKFAEILHEQAQGRVTNTNIHELAQVRRDLLQIVEDLENSRPAPADPIELLAKAIGDLVRSEVDRAVESRLGSD